MKKEKYCYECDTNFTVTFKGSDPVQFCPFCGSALEEDEETFDDNDEG